MRKAITLLLCCCAMAFVARGMHADILPLKAVNSGWMSKPIPVNSNNGTVDVNGTDIPLPYR